MDVVIRRLLASRFQITPTFFSPRCLRLSRPSKFHQQRSTFSSFKPRQSLRDAELEPRAHTRMQLGEEARRPISLRPLLVATGICVGSFIVADYLDGRNDARVYATIRQQGSGWSSGGNFTQAMRFVAEKQMKETMQWLDQVGAPDVVKGTYYTFQHWWIDFQRGNDATHAAVILIAANSVVFLAWQLAARSPALMAKMAMSFVHFPGYSPGYTLLTSLFSHRGFFHFGFNMMALYSFGPTAFITLQADRMKTYPNYQDMGTNEPPRLMNLNSTYHFLAFFISCGVVANLIPHYISLLSLRSPMLMNSTAALALTPQPGLGASGAVISCLAVTALSRPDMEIVLIFLPMVPIAIGYGFAGMVALDAVGVMRGWQTFGHTCHLTGSALGVGAYFYGAEAWYRAQRLLRGGKVQSRK